MIKLTTGILVGLLTQTIFAALPIQPHNQAISKILFGSCIHQDHEQPIWNAVNTEHADLFVFLGDNIYGDTQDMAELKAKYLKLGANNGFQDLVKNTPIVATWDDHDFGENDAGRDYPQKAASRQVMLDFFQEPIDSARRNRGSGLYTSYYFGEGEQIVQLIMLDLRWNRSPPIAQPWYRFYLSRFWDSKGPYEETTGKDATMLGDAQWQWLNQQLSKKAAIRIIASSLPVLPESTGWEAWATFPDERQRLFNLIKETKAAGLFFISGDTHWSEFSKLNNQIDYPLWELTSSGLTEEWKLVSPNSHRVGDFYNQANYGEIEITWQPQPQVSLAIKNVKGQVMMKQIITIDQLSPAR